MFKALQGFIIIILVSACIGCRSADDNKNAAKAYVDKTVPEIIQTWNEKLLIKKIHPEALKQTSTKKIEEIFFIYKKLGAMRNYKNSEGEIETSNELKATFGKFIITADFENGPATITVVIVKQDNLWNILPIEQAKWSIYAFTVDSKIFYGINNVNVDAVKEKIPETQKEINNFIDDFLQKDIIEKRHDINKAFSLAQKLVKDNQTDKAIQLYQAALTADPSELEHQFDLADLLIKGGRKKDAIPHIKFIYELSEREDLFQKAKETLLDMKISLDTPVKVFDIDPIVNFVLVPVGNPNMQVLLELKDKLQEKMGVKVSIAQKGITLGKPDRKFRDQYIDAVFEDMQKNISPLQKATLISELNLDEKSLQNTIQKSRFLIKLFSMSGREGEKFKKEFDYWLDKLGESGQYNSDKVAEEIIAKAFPLSQNEPIAKYIGVTSKDLYAGEGNYTYGGTVGEYGVISYYRFVAENTNEKQNRPRLVTRLLKQALSSCNFLLYIPRCSAPYCARAFPASLDEHDAKGDELCDICKQELKEHKKLISLLIAAQNKDTRKIQSLLKEGINVNKKYSDDTLLALAALNGQTERVKTFLAAGADVNLKSKDDFTPLMTAAQNGHADTIKVLLKAGADINAKQKDGFTALMIATNNGHDKVVQILQNAVR